MVVTHFKGSLILSTKVVNRLKILCLWQITGYILTGLGPFLADGKNSDAKNTEHMLKIVIRKISETSSGKEMFQF